MAASSFQTAPLADSANDISIQAFNGIFGTNWYSMDPQVGGSATIIVEMLALLNELAIFSVALLFTATYAVAVVGTAHEGVPLGRRLHSFWVPVRFSLATGMLVPLKGGLCLFQLLLLMTVGWSIHFANDLWGIFLDSSVKNSIVSVSENGSVATPIRIESEKIASDILANLIVYKYHENNYSTTSNEIAVYDDQFTISGSHRYQFRDPGTLVNSNEKMGSVEVICHTGTSCQEQLAAVRDLIKELEPLAQQLVERGIGRSESMPSSEVFVKAVDTFGQKQAKIIQTVYADELKKLESESGTLLQGAKELGWIGAGSYYHTILGIQSKAADMARIQISSSPPNYGAKADGFRQYGNTLAVAEAYTSSTSVDLKKFVKAAQAGGSKTFIQWVFGENLNVKVVSGIGGMMSDGDPIHAMSTLGNYILTVVDGSVAMYVLLNGVLAGAKDAKENSLIGWATDTFVTQGAVGGVLTGLKSALESFAPMFWMLVIALWAIANILAFYLPAVPLILWLSAVVGWLLLIVEALVAAPLWIVAHAMPEGEGLSGDRGKQGYMLFLGILMRPFLMLLGLCIAMVLTGTLGKLISFLFTIYISSWEAHAGGWIVPIHSTIAYIVILGSIMMITTHKLFSLISYLPDTVLRWIGGHLSSLGEGADEHKTNVMIGGFVNRLEGAMRGGAGAGMGKAIHDSMNQQQQAGNAKEESASGGISKTTQQLASGDKSVEDRKW